MEKLNITFLGTGNAIPTKQRNHTAILISWRNENILVDCGEGTQRQFKIAEISPAKITKLLITHWHGDHVLGIPGLFQTLAMSEYQKNLQVYGPKGTLNYLGALTDIFKDFKINLDIKEIGNALINLHGIMIESREMTHGIPTNAYSIIIPDKIRLDKKKLRKFKIPDSPLLKQLQHGKDIIVNGRKIKASQVSYIEKGRKITIILDTGINHNALELAKNSDILIIESTFSKEEEIKARESMHLTAEDAATIAKKAKAKKLILTHISQRYEHNLKAIEKEAKKIFRNTKIVKDFDKLTL